MQNRQKTALISVYNKEGITDFTRELVGLGWKIISSGGTAKHLSEAGIPVTDVAEITGMPAILSHRVVTLHPKIHGGLLALDREEHLAELEQYGIPYIDMVCCDLYPLEEEINKPEATRESVIEKTDIGGPTMLRAGAKGGRITICDPKDRSVVINWLKDGEPDKEKFVNTLSARTEMVIAKYCLLSATYLSDGVYKGIVGKKSLECAYGENAYQKPASLYKLAERRPALRKNEGRAFVGDPLAIANWQLIAGSPLSYNNICDVDRMLQTMTHIGAGFEKNFQKVPFVAIGAKHGNACGASVGGNEIETIDKMLQGDLRAIFGGSVMLNFNVDEKIADELMHKYMGEGSRRLLDIVAGPSFTPEAIEILSRKKGKCRILVNPNIEKAGMSSLDTTSRFRYVRGGFLTQPNYTFVPEIYNQAKQENSSRLTRQNQSGFDTTQNFLVSPGSAKDVLLAWAIGCTSNSNTITIVKECRLYGNGVGQQDRVGAAKLAILRADDASEFQAERKNLAALPASGLRHGLDFSAPLSTKSDLEGAVAYSDSFFPFPDAVEVLISRGIKTIFSTSGSVNDEKTIELCKQKGVNLILLPDTEARGFYQH